MKKVNVALVIVGSVLFSNPSISQSQFAGWFASFNSIKLGKKLGAHLDLQLRTNDEWKEIQTKIVRPGINFHLNNRIVLTAGYAYVNNRRTVSGVTGYVTEHRTWQQLLFTHKIFNTPLVHRFRVEQRFIPNVVHLNGSLETDGSEIAHRLRYFFRNVIPLKKSTPFSRGVFGAIQNEVFVNIGNNDAVNGEFFDQNRLYLAAGYRVSPKADIELGYLYQYINGSGDLSTRINVLQFAGYLRL